MGVLTHTKQACTASPKTYSAFTRELNRENRYSPLNLIFREKRVQLCSVSLRDREHPLAQTQASLAGM